MQMTARTAKALFLTVVLLCSACATDPKKFYEGPARSASDTATIVSHRGFSLHVDGRMVLSSASVLPGNHRIVVESHDGGIGYVELDVRAGRIYTARSKAAKDQTHAWAIDLKTCRVVAGTPPEKPNTMHPADLGCAEKELKLGSVVGGVAALPLVLGAVFATGGNIPVDQQPDACGVSCYAAPDALDVQTARLLLPPWRAQEDEGCATVARYRCLLRLTVDGFRVRANARDLALAPGQYPVVFKVLFRHGLWWHQPYTLTDGLTLDAKFGRTYALCLFSDETGRNSAWVVDNETGQVVAGKKTGTDGKAESRYSHFCPHF